VAGTLTGSFTVDSSAPAGGYTLTVQTDAGPIDSATSNFSVIPTYTVTFHTDTSSATVTVDSASKTDGATGTYTSGARVHVVANAPSGYQFSYWETNGVSVDSTPLQDTYMTVNNNGWLRAHFTKQLAVNVAGISQPYLLGFRVSNVYSYSATGDSSYSSTDWSPTEATFTVTLGPGESFFVIGTAQVWNSYASVGSSIAITRNGIPVSGDMFAAGATITSRELATAVAVDTPSAGTYTYSLSAKTDPGGKAWISQPYIVGFRVSDANSGSAIGDFSYSTTGWSASPASFTVNLAAGESLFLIGTAQVWNDDPSIGASIAVTRDGTLVSGDLFAAGATITSRELGTAIAVDTPGAGTYTYALSAKTDPGGRAWISQPYVLGFKVSTVYSASQVGDQYISKTSWSSARASFSATLGAGDSIFLIGTAQVWNNNATIGSSMAITQGDVRVSGDMFATGATITHRELAVAIAVSTPGAGTWTYALSAKTD
jgi:hypothetical protein